MELAEPTERELDAESADWLRRLPTAAMSDLERLERFLRTDPRDVGCDEARAVLHIYVDLITAGADAAEHYPGVAAHLLACGPCAEDFAGLLTAVSGD